MICLPTQYTMWTLVVVLVIMWWFMPRRKNHVLHEYANSAQAAQLISRVVARMIRFMRVLRAKYYIDVTDDVREQNRAHIEQLDRAPGRTRAKIAHLLDNFNPETIYENRPRTAGETSYTVNKGDSMWLCVRDPARPTVLVHEDDLVFVVLHECSHIANFDGMQHEASFWSTFKFILHEAHLAGVYTPRDYARQPAHYCGLVVDYNPLFDVTVPEIWR